MAAIKWLASLMAAATIGSTSARAQDVVVQGLIDLSGPTADLGLQESAGRKDLFKWVNEHGGVNGKKIVFEEVDTAYNNLRALSAYKDWMSKTPPASVVMTYGAADSQALAPLAARDGVALLGLAAPAALSVPVSGSSKYVAEGAPAYFSYGPTYSDMCRGLVKWALKDWKAKGKTEKPKFIYAGDNHPFPNAPRDACTAEATESGFEVLPTLRYSLAGGDFKAQCLTLQSSGANYAYLANPTASTVSFLKSCETVGVSDIQFLGNIYVFDEASATSVGPYGNGIVLALAVPPYGSNVPGMRVLEEITGGVPRRNPYTQMLCGAALLVEALRWADQNGGVSGPNVAKGFYQKKDWVPLGLDGVCLPSTYTEQDHRGVDQVPVYRVKIAASDTQWEHLDTISLPRSTEWFGR
jgi:branched-chain amino acid transport system substrate-binding protein